MRTYIVLLFFTVTTAGECNELYNDKLHSLDLKNNIAYVGGEKIHPMKWGKFDNVLLKIDFNNEKVKKVTGPWSSNKHYIRQVGTRTNKTPTLEATKNSSLSSLSALSDHIHG